MSESPLRGIVLGHGALADGLVDAVRQITGADADALVAISNRGLSPQALAARIEELAGTAPVVLFTDLQSGSCALAARRLCHERPGLVVLSGVNLPVLLDFVMHRDMEISSLIPRLVEKGRVAIGCVPQEIGAADARPLQGG